MSSPVGQLRTFLSFLAVLLPIALCDARVLGLSIDDAAQRVAASGPPGDRRRDSAAPVALQDTSRTAVDVLNDFQSWAVASGADMSKIHFAWSPDRGSHALAARELAAGEELYNAPAAMSMNWHTALDTPIIRDILRLGYAGWNATLAAERAAENGEPPLQVLPATAAPVPVRRSADGSGAFDPMGALPDRGFSLSWAADQGSDKALSALLLLHYERFVAGRRSRFWPYLEMMPQRLPPLPLNWQAILSGDDDAALAGLPEQPQAQAVARSGQALSVNVTGGCAAELAGEDLSRFAASVPDVGSSVSVESSRATAIISLFMQDVFCRFPHVYGHPEPDTCLLGAAIAADRQAHVHLAEQQQQQQQQQQTQHLMPLPAGMSRARAWRAQSRWTYSMYRTRSFSLRMERVVAAFDPIADILNHARQPDAARRDIVYLDGPPPKAAALGSAAAAAAVAATAAAQGAAVASVAAVAELTAAAAGADIAARAARPRVRDADGRAVISTVSMSMVRSAGAGAELYNSYHSAPPACCAAKIMDGYGFIPQQGPGDDCAAVTMRGSFRLTNPVDAARLALVRSLNMTAALGITLPQAAAASSSGSDASGSSTAAAVDADNVPWSLFVPLQNGAPLPRLFLATQRLQAMGLREIAACVAAATVAPASACNLTAGPVDAETEHRALASTRGQLRNLLAQHDILGQQWVRDGIVHESALNDALYPEWMLQQQPQLRAQVQLQQSSQSTCIRSGSLSERAVLNLVAAHAASVRALQHAVDETAREWAALLDADISGLPGHRKY